MITNKMIVNRNGLESYCRIDDYLTCYLPEANVTKKGSHNNDQNSASAIVVQGSANGIPTIISVRAALNQCAILQIPLCLYIVRLSVVSIELFEASDRQTT